MWRIGVGVCLLVSLSCARPAPQPATRGAILDLEVKSAEGGSNAGRRQSPWKYPGFEKRIAELEGKTVLDVLGSKLTVQLLNNRPRLGNSPDYRAADFVCAIVRGRIVRNREMKYDLQDSQECRVTTAAGECTVGIYYAPVGYMVLPGGESYWFLFENGAR